MKTKKQTEVLEVALLDSTDGSEILVKERASLSSEDGFNYVHPDYYEHRPEGHGEPTEEIRIEIRKMEKDATFAEAFGPLSEDPSKLCLTLPQIKDFLKKCRSKWLPAHRYEVFFLFESKGELYILKVAVGTDNHLRLYTYEYDDPEMWDDTRTRHLVVPELT